MNRRKLIITFTALIAILVVVFSSYFGWRYYRYATLKIEAKVIYNMGGPQPVARQSFYLMKVNFIKKYLDDSEIIEKSYNDDDRLVRRMGIALLMASTSGRFKRDQIDPESVKTLLGTLENMRPVFTPYLVNEVVTDFSGIAEFKDVKPGTYYLMGITETRKGIAFWNVEVGIKRGDNQLILSQENALHN